MYPTPIKGSLWDGDSEEGEEEEVDVPETTPSTRAKDFLKSRVEAGKVKKLRGKKNSKAVRH